MAEYIKRRDALKVLEEMEDIERGLSAMHDLPAADVVEVVRCKDCKYNCDEDITGKYILCNGKMLGMVRAEDFCSFGERRENDATD